MKRLSSSAPSKSAAEGFKNLFGSSSKKARQDVVIAATAEGQFSQDSPDTVFFPNAPETTNIDVPAELSADPSLPVQVNEVSQETEGNDNVTAAVWDIGQALKPEKPLTMDDKYEFIIRSWNPPEGYSFPKKKEGSGQSRLFYADYLKTYPWMSYSESMCGVLCRHCVLFAKPTSNVRLGSFSTMAVTKWKDIHSDARGHQEKKYHLDALVTAKNHRDLVDGKRVSIVEQIDRGQQEKRKIASDGVICIAKSVLFCGRQGIALRGHSDNFVIDPNVDYFNNNNGQRYGNFNACNVLQCSRGETRLINHLTKSGQKSKLITSRAQNEMIEIAGKIIQEHILNRIMKATYFSILADGTTDIYKLDQFCLVVRYLFEERLYEDFLEYVVVSGSTTIEALADKILERLSHHGLDAGKLRGQGYDGASNMTGIKKGVKTRILEKYPKALFTHCGAHVLNLSIGDSCQELPMIKMFGVVNQVGVFFSSSAKRTDLFDTFCPVDQQGQRPKLLCTTRWSSREVTLTAMVSLMKPITEALDELSTTGDRDTKALAANLSVALRNFEILIALSVAKYYMELMAQLSATLQSPQLDIVAAMTEVDNLLNLFRGHRSDFETRFKKKMWMSTLKLAEALDVEVSIPRRTGRQTCRNNVRTDDPEEYYRISVGVPFLDHLLASLTERFSGDVAKALNVAQLLPSYVVDSDSDFTELALMYCDDLPSFHLFDTELERWKCFWESKPASNRPRTVMSALKECSSEFYPNIRELLVILAVLPVSVAEWERSFSTLKRLKTYIRSTMGEDRLVGLALLNIHDDVIVTPEEVAKRFMLEPDRRVIR